MKNYLSSLAPETICHIAIFLHPHQIREMRRLSKTFNTWNFQSSPIFARRNLLHCGMTHGHLKGFHPHKLNWMNLGIPYMAAYLSMTYIFAVHVAIFARRSRGSSLPQFHLDDDCRDAIMRALQLATIVWGEDVMMKRFAQPAAFKFAVEMRSRELFEKVETLLDLNHPIVRYYWKEARSMAMRFAAAEFNTSSSTLVKTRKLAFKLIRDYPVEYLYSNYAFLLLWPQGEEQALETFLIDMTVPEWIPASVTVFADGGELIYEAIKQNRTDLVRVFLRDPDVAHTVFCQASHGDYLSDEMFDVLYDHHAVDELEALFKLSFKSLNRLISNILERWRMKVEEDALTTESDDETDSSIEGSVLKEDSYDSVYELQGATLMEDKDDETLSTIKDSCLKNKDKEPLRELTDSGSTDEYADEISPAIPIIMQIYEDDCLLLQDEYPYDFSEKLAAYCRDAWTRSSPPPDFKVLHLLTDKLEIFPTFFDAVAADDFHTVQVMLDTHRGGLMDTAPFHRVSKEMMRLICAHETHVNLFGPEKRNELQALIDKICEWAPSHVVDMFLGHPCFSAPCFDGIVVKGRVTKVKTAQLLMSCDFFDPFWNSAQVICKSFSCKEVVRIFLSDFGQLEEADVLLFYLVIQATEQETSRDEGDSKLHGFPDVIQMILDFPSVTLSNDRCLYLLRSAWRAKTPECHKVVATIIGHPKFQLKFGIEAMFLANDAVENGGGVSGYLHMILGYLSDEIFSPFHVESLLPFVAESGNVLAFQHLLNLGGIHDLSGLSLNLERLVHAGHNDMLDFILRRIKTYRVGTEIVTRALLVAILTEKAVKGGRSNGLRVLLDHVKPVNWNREIAVGGSGAKMASFMRTDVKYVERRVEREGNVVCGKNYVMSLCFADAVNMGEVACVKVLLDAGVKLGVEMFGSLDFELFLNFSAVLEVLVEHPRSRRWFGVPSTKLLDVRRLMSVLY
ncbi:hypothetical protein BC829DRAFT_433398 [Chytridium lagenaria]|nr:hypothetical protein BC829DRAFT_433398 [Chytridium lagenaria]